MKWAVTLGMKLNRLTVRTWLLIPLATCSLLLICVFLNLFRFPFSIFLFCLFLFCSILTKVGELAERIGLANKSQSCIETGKNYPSADVVEKYAQAFNLDVSEILNIEHIKSKEELVREMNLIFNKADEKQIITAYRIIKSIFD